MLSPALSDFLASTIIAADPCERFRATLGLEPDDWQQEFLSAEEDIVACLVSRQAGKSTSTSILAYDMISRGEFNLCLAPSERQSKELARKVLLAHGRDRHAPTIVRSTQTELELLNGGRFVVIPASSDTIRGYSSADCIILEEAAFIPDDAINAVLPSLSDTGKLIAITTPGGSKDCFFYHMWAHGDGVRRILARATQIPRMAKRVEFLRRTLPDIRFRVEVELEWLGSGAQWIAQHVIDNAVTQEVSCLRL